MLLDDSHRLYQVFPVGVTNRGPKGKAMSVSCIYVVLGSLEVAEAYLVAEAGPLLVLFGQAGS